VRGYRTLIFALLIFSAATTFSIVKIVREYSIITEKFIPNLWVAAQGNLEFQRLVSQVGLAGAGSSQATKDLETRLYILMSRMPLLLQGSESQHVRAVPGAVQMIKALVQTLSDIEDEVLTLKAGDAAGARAIYEKLEPFAVPMHQLMGSTMQMDETVASLQREGLRRVYWELLLCFAGITASASALVFLLFKALRKMKGLLDVAHAAEMAASEARARMSAVMDAVPARISARDRAGREVFRNQYEAETAARAAPSPDAAGLYGSLDEQIFRTGESVPLFEVSTAEQDGGQRVWLVTKVPLSDRGGRIVNVVTVALDISEQKEAQRRNALLATALENAGDAIEITDHEGRFEYVNPAFERISGYGSTEAIGQTPFSLLMSDAADGPSYYEVQRVISAGHPWRGILTAQRKSGELYQQETSISPVRSPEGQISHFVAVKRDITERLQTEQRIWHVAHHDPLTDLPNRVLFLQRLEEAMAEARDLDRLVAVLFLDLDRFKDVNDTLGHHAGDDLLRLLTQRLLSATRETDTVARLGGDEFAIIHTRVRDRVDAGQLAQRILDRLCMPFIRDNQEFQISASIGITIFPDDAQDSQELLKNADLAMYRAKAAGRSNFQFFEIGMDVVFQRRKAIERGLRRALEVEAFELYYQPQIDLATQRMVGAEALLRWTHPEFGPVSPSEFIPVAEECGLIAPIGEWVLETACRQNKAWQDAGLPPIHVAVNLSAAQFLRRDLVGSILRTLEGAGSRRRISSSRSPRASSCVTRKGRSPCFAASPTTVSTSPSTISARASRA
jgi:diguanylate cyclase (GGDEF)-like protein/PAS domain S-box-containing protein